MKYKITIERPTMKYWRGVKVPFIVMVRLHYPSGNRVWFNLFGPNFFDWAKQVHLKKMMNGNCHD